MHSGADLQSAAATVMGYQQAAVKGKAILVDPVPNAATDKLKRILQDCLLAQALQVCLYPHTMTRSKVFASSWESRDTATARVLWWEAPHCMWIAEGSQLCALGECNECQAGQQGCMHLQAKGALKEDVQGLLWGLGSFLMARRELLPFIQDGNKGCGGRLRYRRPPCDSGEFLACLSAPDLALRTLHLPTTE